MIVYDRIIANIQRAGGATVLFDEIVDRLVSDNISFTQCFYGVPVQGAPNSVRLEARLFERYRKCLLPHELSEFEEFSIFHSTCYRLPRRWRGKIVTTVHDFTYERVIGGVRRAAHSLQKNLAILSSDAIICVSENTRQDLYRYLPRTKDMNVIVVHNGVSHIFNPIMGCSEGGGDVLFVGSRAGYKNFEQVVRAVNQCVGVRLRCVGGGGFIKSELEIMDRLIPGRYSHAGYVSTERLNEEYNHALCLVYPSSYEGFGIPVVEAMQAGCPVVAVNSSSLPEVLGDAGYLIDSPSPAMISAAINHMQNPKNRKLYVSKGLERAKQFSWDRCYRETLEAYKSTGWMPNV